MTSEEKGYPMREAKARFERRRYPRCDIDLPVRYQEIDSLLRSNGRAMNASEGGLMIYFTEPMKIGKNLRMILFFPPVSEMTPIEMFVEIVWTEIQLDTGWGDYRCGVNFTDISPDHVNNLKKFMEGLSLQV